MKKLITPTLQITIGLLSLTMSLIFVAYAFGLFPNEQTAKLETRARIAENIAIQLANLAQSNDAAAIKRTIASVIDHDKEILSVGVRGADGKLLVGTDGHETGWIAPPDNKSTATHIQVPLMNDDVGQGKIEIQFRPLESDKNFFGNSKTILVFASFISVAGFAGYYFILRRALRELDPAGVIPDRVKAAFDTLAAGILIIDTNEIVLLANSAFVNDIYGTQASLLGTNASALPWIQSSDTSPALERPWQTAIRSGQSIKGVGMGIRNCSGKLQSLIVNATRIVDGKGAVRGVIATFDDVTLLHQTNKQLNASIEQLHRFQQRISDQNEKLQALASTDPLTGCLNRRAFFETLRQELHEARITGKPISVLMVDADHFKSINDRFGHDVGDKVLIGVVTLLKTICADRGIVGRYGGEEFCIAMPGFFERDAEQLAERIRRAVADVSTWLPNNERVTISIGIASATSVHYEVSDLTKRADEALYAAKAGGRNRFVSWGRMQSQQRPPLSA